MSPPSGKRPPASAEEWLAHARSDLRLALLARESGDVMAGQICFHAQQAAEKALKAVLLSRKVEFPLIHDLDELIEILEEANISLPESVADAGALTPYAVETRYPGWYGEITGGDVDDAVRLAGEVVRWADETVKAGGAA